MDSEPSFPSQLLSDKNQSLRSENRRLRERLLELYIQVNTLSSLSSWFGPPEDSQSPPIRRLTQYQFIQTDSYILPGGAIYAAAVDRRGENIALASLSGAVTILSSELKQSTVLSGHALACRDVYWGSTGLVSCGFDKTIRIWDIEKSTNQVIQTNGLAHSVCGCDSDPNFIFAATGDQIFWIDKRRATPITISAGTQATAVTSHKNLLVFGGYNGSLAVTDRRSLQHGPIATLKISDGPVSSLSKVLGSGRCVAVSTFSAPHILELEESIEHHDLRLEAPGRFGCRADIAEEGLIFDGDFAVACGGKTAAFVDGAIEISPQLFDNVGGFQYGAVFMRSIYQKILTYSEDGMVSVWSLHS